MKKTIVLAAILAAVLCISGNLLAYTGSGDGSSGNPYQIANVADFEQLCYTTTDWSLSFILTANLDLDEVFIIPVGNSGIQFTGVFNGNDKIISNAVINQPGWDYVGLFGYVGSGGQICNLGVEDVNITGRSYVGGLVGRNGGSLTSCYATGSVIGTGTYVGGLVGEKLGSGLLTSCYATGSVSGTSSVGGLVGRNGGGSLTSCYATGSVTGTGNVGGLVGRINAGTVTGCYATGLVSGSTYVGGLVGQNDTGTVTNCFWDKDTSGQTTSDGGTGKTTVEMKTLSTFTDAGWDFINMWFMPDDSYPHLGCEHYEGSGTQANPYQIYSPQQMNAIGANPADWGKYFKLMADVNMSVYTGTQYNIIGNPTTEFTGVFDGNGHIISNLTITAPTQDYIGLFGYVSSGGQIKNLGVENVNITGRYYVGGLVGENHGTLTDCYATGSVTGDSSIGGLVGLNWGTLTSCYATGSIDGTNYVGGLVGRNSVGTLTSCYATGPVSGTYSIGGLIGFNDGILITSCYATGLVSGSTSVGGLVGWNLAGSVIGSFWDTQTSGQPTSDGGTGKTTAEMKQINTFANWDFAETWGIEDNQTYPFLKLTYPAGDLNHDKVVDFFDFAILAEHWLEGV